MSSSIFKNLNSDIINQNIVPLLPAKSLIRFSSACKLWYHLIKSPDFIEAHLNINRSHTNHQILFSGINSCYLVINETLIELGQPPFNVRRRFYWDNFFGSCNGLILTPNYNMESHRLDYWLWNPCIKKMKRLEFEKWKYYSELNCYYVAYELFGLGFHESSKDHRVVRILYAIDDMTRSIGDIPSRVYVYSLSTNLWHRADSTPSGSIGIFTGCCFNGVNHWLATTRYSLACIYTPDTDNHLKSILLFDFRDECFSEMMLPEDLHYNIETVQYFNECKGSLAMVVDDRKDDNTVNIYSNITMYMLWVMTDYGVKESWTKKYTVIAHESSTISRWPIALLKIGILVCCTEQKEQEDQEKRTSVDLYDVDRGQSRYTFNQPFEPFPLVLDFMDNLVLFQG